MRPLSLLLIELIMEKDCVKERRRLYKAKKRKGKKRMGRLERLKEAMQKKEDQVKLLAHQTVELKKVATKATINNKLLKRKLNETELENIVLRDPRSRTNRLNRLNFSGTVGTSGRFLHPATSLLPSIKIICPREIGLPISTSSLGEGRFGKCYLHTYGHFKVCIKVLKNSENSALIHEANILSKFSHLNLPYLFGVCIGECPSIVTSFHGYKSQSTTVHCALFKELFVDIDWKEVLIHIIQGLEHLHNKHKLLHNDLKGDNVLLTSTFQGTLSAVIIDFGKACEVSQGKRYNLTSRQKEYYKLNHPHISPDLRDGLCKQSPSSDIYSFGRIMKMINTVSSLKSDRIMELSQKCMQYDGQLRPDILQLKESMLI